MSRLMGREFLRDEPDRSVDEALQNKNNELLEEDVTLLTKDVPSTEHDTVSTEARIRRDHKNEQKNVVKNTVKIAPMQKPEKEIGTNTTNMDESDTSLNKSMKNSDIKMLQKQFDFLRICFCFLLAFLCRKVLAFGYGMFYVQTIVLPFMCLETALYLFRQHMLSDIDLPHKASFIMGVLVLCGLRQDVIETYTKIMGYFSAIAEDFAIFLFSFLMSNIIVS
ncbi:hypothetical protein CHS0354_019052 [Potamilus streckersoni]|uniref:Uncharacterized protein n=1 Tax=Potamilus streckersoni TaxID=2493646 RepID=A0AAE0SJ04_9BIVA|nr:hypothetical protein CHS0354_019052 [Potamilus streckersoni]